MRLLLDAHALLWWLEDSPVLRREARTAIGESPEVLVSVVTAWELTIKTASGRLSTPPNLQEVIEDRLKDLPVTLAHAMAAGRLPRLHGDPFDRMLVAQAQLEGLTIVTRDADIARYDVPVIAA